MSRLQPNHDTGESSFVSIEARAKQLFFDAVDLPKGERTAFVGRACGEDVALRDAVLALLGHSDLAGESFLAGPTTGTSGTSLASAIASGAPSNAIGPFRPLRIIGEGGMGTVYEAEQHHPRRRVALKVIRGGRLSESLRRRFEHEAEILGRLSHPHIAQLHEFGVSESGQLFFAMEFVPGKPLRAFCDEENLPTRARIELMIAICQAVDYAHRQGVIHRDLKPGNILVARHDDKPWPKVIDFGIAKATDAAGFDQTALTMSQQILGTPAYMSPEQIAGDMERIDARTDIYALGVILYELVSGRLPFDLRQRPLAEAARIVREDEPSALTIVAGGSQGARKADRDLSTIVAKTLEKTPARRYASAAELANDLLRYINHEPIVARPASAAYQLRKFAQRHRAIVAGTAAVFVTLIAGIIGTSVALRQALVARDAEQAAKQLAQKNADEARRSARRSEAVVTLLTRDLVGMGDDPRNMRDIRFSEVLDRAAARAEETLSGEPDLRAAVFAALSRSYGTLGLFQPATATADAALRAQSEMPPGQESDLYDTYKLRGAAALEMDRFEAAEADLKKARAGLSALHGEDDARTLDVDSDLAALHERRGEFPKAIALRKRVCDGRRRIFGERSTEYLRAAVGLGASLMRSGDSKAAEAQYRALIAEMESHPGEHTLELSAALHDLTTIYTEIGELDAAEVTCRRVLEITSKTRDPQHPDVLAARSQLANILSKRGNRSEALRIRQEVVADYRARLGPDHQHTLTAVNNLANSLSMTGRHAEAEPLLRDNLARRIAKFGQTHPDIAEAQEALAGCLVRQKKWSEAVENYEAALEVARRVFPPDSPYETQILSNLATAMRDGGVIESAEVVMRMLIEQEARSLGPVANYTLDDQRMLAELLLMDNRPLEAEALIRDVVSKRPTVDPKSTRRFVRDRLTLAEALRDLGSFAAAEAVFDQVEMHLDVSDLGDGLLRRLADGRALLFERWMARSDDPGLAAEFETWRACAAATRHP